MYVLSNTERLEFLYIEIATASFNWKINRHDLDSSYVFNRIREDI